MTTPPCAGKWDLFDSTDYYDHRQARQLCTDCPMITACQDALQQAALAARSVSRGGGPRGTWAGQLVGNQVANAHRIAAEEAMFTTDEARAAHSTWAHTPRDRRHRLSDRIRLGERVYQRRCKRNQGAAA